MKLTTKDTNTKKHIAQIMGKTKEYLYTIWKTRCEKFSEWEKQQKINTKQKTKYKNNRKTDKTDTTMETIRKDKYVNLVNRYIWDYMCNGTKISSIFYFKFSAN